MRKTLIITPLLLLGISAAAQPKLGKASIDKVIDAMTVEEKINLVVGSGGNKSAAASATVGDFGALVPGAAGQTNAIPRLGIPATTLADGPAGLRIDPTRIGTLGHSMGAMRTLAAAALDAGYLTFNDIMLNVLCDEFGESFTEEEIAQNADELAAARLNDMNYNQLMHGLKLAKIDINRKMLSQIAIDDPKGFATICSKSQKALEKESAKKEA